MRPPQEYSFKNPDDVSIRDVVLGIRRWIIYFKKKWIIVLIAIFVGAGAGIFYSTLKTPVYKAITTFVLEEEDGGLSGQYAGMAALVGVDIAGGGGLFKGENIIELYKSRTMLQKALLSEGNFDGRMKLFIDRYLEVNKIRQSWNNSNLKNISFDNPKDFTVTHDSIIGIVIEQIRTKILTVERAEKNLTILKVEVKSKDEKFSKLFNDELVSAVNDFYIETKTKKSVENINILQRQTDSVMAVMSGAILSSARIVDATPNLNPARQVLRAGAQNSQLNAETNRTILSELLKNLEMAKISLRKETPLIQVIDQPVFPLPKITVGKIKAGIIGSGIFLLICLLCLTTKKIYTDNII